MQSYRLVLQKDPELGSRTKGPLSAVNTNFGGGETNCDLRMYNAC